jgi:phage-related holin
MKHFDHIPSVGKLLMMVFTILTPIYPVMITILILIIIDFISGVYAALRKHERISSKKIGNTVAKIILLNLGVLSSYLVETYIVPEIPFVKVTAGFVALIELTSILENINKATGVNIITAFKRWLSRQTNI